VRVSREFLEGRWAQTRASKVNDSKQLSAEQRDEVFEDLQGLVAAGEIAMGVGRAEVGEIESLNILGATKLAMRRAMEQIYPPEVFRQREEPDLFSAPEALATFQPTVNCRVLVDGLKLRGFPYPHEGVVHGDARSLCIAMASVAAKVTRDRAMVAMDGEYPGYGFAAHKGYGTEEHRVALLRQGLDGRQLRRLFITHAHSDHMGGNAALQAEYGCSITIPAGAATAVAGWDADALMLSPLGQSAPAFTYDSLIAAGAEVDVVQAVGYGIDGEFSGNPIGGRPRRGCPERRDAVGQCEEQPRHEGQEHEERSGMGMRGRGGEHRCGGEPEGAKCDDGCG
jgi:ribonuclease HII